jgi:predicted transcriptional regulator
MTTTAIRFADDERDLIQSYADFHGETFSSVVRSAVMDVIDDWLDVQAYNEALANDDGSRHTHEEIGKMLGLL